VSPTRVNDASDRCDPRCLPSFKIPCPAAPFRMPGSGLLSGSRLGRRNLFLAASFATADPFEPSIARFPSARPFAVGNRAFLNPGGACRLLQPSNNTRAHPASVSILTREWSSRSAARRHQPMPVALAPRYVAASRAGESQPVLESSRFRDPLAWTRQIANRDHARKGETRVL